MSSPYPIDAVYTWVDGDRSDYAELVRGYASSPGDGNPERFRDPFDSLRYSLRSLAQFAPWLRRIHIFTCRPHAPAWLRRDHPRVRLVHHDEVETAPDVLPTFNSNVIESLLHRLPGLSDHFLYFNDDYFLGAPITPSHFYAPDGRIRIAGSWMGEYFRHRVYEHQWLSFGLLEHGPMLIDRELWAEMQQAAAGEIAALQRHRFRQRDDVRPDRLYRWYALTHARDRAVAEPAWRYLRYARFLKVTNRPAKLARQLARLRAAAPAYFCLNDDLGPHPSPAALAAMGAFLADYFPQPSPFERGPS